MDLKLKGKLALVTGSSAGLGEAMVRMLAQEDADVIVHGRNKERAFKVAEDIRKLGRNVHVVLGDLSNEEGANQVISEVKKIGPVDILVNNAGGYHHVGWFDAKPEQWAETFEDNVISAVRMIHAFVPNMKERGWGRVIQIGGGLGIQPITQHPNYNASLSARHNLAVSLARELKGSGVTSNVVSPGAILVDSVKEYLKEIAPMRNWGTDLEEIERKTVAEIVPNDVGRLGRPEEIAGAVCYLCSSFADYISGAIIRVDGGTLRSL